jgi:hypothetical protein
VGVFVDPGRCFETEIIIWRLFGARIDAEPVESKLFACFPDVKNKIGAFCCKKENLASLSAESLRNEIIDIVPAIYETLLQE